MYDIELCKCGEVIIFIKDNTQICQKCNDVHFKIEKTILNLKKIKILKK